MQNRRPVPKRQVSCCVKDQRQASNQPGSCGRNASQGEIHIQSSGFFTAENAEGAESRIRKGFIAQIPYKLFLRVLCALCGEFLYHPVPGKKLKFSSFDQFSHPGNSRRTQNQGISFTTTIVIIKSDFVWI
jgi:hypothetical protein